MCCFAYRSGSASATPRRCWFSSVALAGVGVVDTVAPRCGGGRAKPGPRASARSASRCGLTAGPLASGGCPRVCWGRSSDAAVALARLAGEAQIEALDELGNAVGVHLELVADAELGQGLWVGLCDAAEVDKLAEESLEAGGRDDLQKPRREIAGVPEGVPLVARLEDQIAWACGHDFVAQQRPDASLHYVAVFVLVCVAVQRGGERSGGHRVLDHRESVSGVLAVEHKPNADASEEPGVAVLEPHDLRGYGFHRCAFQWTVVSRRSYSRQPAVSNFIGRL